MLTSFCEQTKKALKYYVYSYSDPDTQETFYIGKGHNNRVFDHLKQKNSSDKVKKIQEILKKGKEPIIEILAHGLKDEDTALAVERALIDYLGVDNLTNEQRGHGAKKYGKMEVNMINAKLGGMEFSKNQIKENVVLISVNETYNENMSDCELYDITRAYWTMAIDQASKAEYAFSVYHGIVLEVYKIAGWFQGHSTINSIFQEEMEYQELSDARIEFVGNIAPDEIRNKYKGSTITDKFSGRGFLYSWK